MDYDLHYGDCLEVMRAMAENSVDSVVADPPYGIGFMGKAWDGVDIAARHEKRKQYESQDPTAWNVRGGHKSAAAAAGSYDLSPPAMLAFQEFSEEWAREAIRVLKPGGYLLSFASTRTYHRMVCGIEGAGFEIRDQLAWVFGSGFPKSHNGDWGGTALKPAWEPICMARKPLIGTVEANWQEHGTGALNIDGCRIPTSEDLRAGAGGIPCRHDEAVPRGRPLRTARRNHESDESRNAYGKGLAGSVAVGETTLGRWPANLIHDGSDEVVALFPTTSSGIMKAGTVRAAQDEPGSVCFGTFGGNATDADTFGDSGSAARFFYCAKADRADRNDGTQGVLTWVREDQSQSEDVLLRLQKVTSDAMTLLQDACAWSTTSFGSATKARFLMAIKSIMETTTKPITTSEISNCSRSWSTNDCIQAAIATARANGSSLAELVAFTSQSILNITDEKTASALGAVLAALQMLLRASKNESRANGHPTVKPTDLMRYLCRLVTPKGGLILDPFMGSGSTGRGAVLEGFKFIGIEQMAEYVEIARARIDSAWRQGHQPSLNLEAA